MICSFLSVAEIKTLCDLKLSEITKFTFENIKNIKREFFSLNKGGINITLLYFIYDIDVKYSSDVMKIVESLSDDSFYKCLDLHNENNDINKK